MKITGSWLSVLLASVTCALAQVKVEVTLPQEQFLLGEALPVAVRVANRTGQTLRLGAAEDWLTFAVESREGGVVQKIGEPPVVGEFDLKSSEVAIKRVDLAPYFTFNNPGRYAVTATVRVRAVNQEITSAPKSFSVIPGVTLWEQEAGLPRPPGATNTVPEIRRYILQQANYLKGQLHLYLRVMDAEGKLSKVFPIGPLVSFSRPEPQVDQFSNLHVLWQTGPYSFSYTVFDPDGEALLRQTYDYIDTRPRLKVGENGGIFVSGGVRRITANDLPAPQSATSTNTSTKPLSSSESVTPQNP